MGGYMKRKLSLIFLILFVILNFYTIVSYATQSPLELLEETLIQQLQQPILMVVGPNWFRGDEKILEIRQDQRKADTVYVKVQVIGFVGPHNPPYTEEIITHKVAGHKVKPTDYYKRVIPENEWYKFKFLVN
jgi:hypothetical protein